MNTDPNGLEHLWHQPGVRARVELEGEWRLDSQWRAFTGTLVVHEDHAFVWRARAQVGQVVVRGHESLHEGVGTMDWRLFGRLPAMQREGPDIDRSMAGRWVAESLWLRQATGGSLSNRAPGLEVSDGTFWVERWGAPAGDERFDVHRYGGRFAPDGEWELGWADQEPMLRFRALEIERAQSDEPL